MSSIQCSVVSLEGTIFEGQVNRVVMQSVAGEIAIYKDHSPMLLEIIPSTIKLVDEAEVVEYVYISGGYAEILPEGVTIFADTIVRSDELDQKTALKLQEEANKLLESDATQKGDEYQNARLQLIRALAQLRTISRAIKGKGNQG